MSIRIQCPYCDAIYSVTERAVGRRVRCPVCDELVEVSPNLLTPEEDAAYEEQQAAGGDEEAETVAPIEESRELEPLGANQPEPEPPPFIAAPQAPPPAEPPPALKSPAPVVFHHGRERPDFEMDMTPMVDVTFLLLIFFMVTASFTMQKSLNVPKPETTEASTQPQTVQDFQDNPDYVVVRVDANNTFHIAATAFDDEIEAPSEQELLVRLRQARQGDAEGNIPSKMLVMANGGATHERVVMAIDAGNDVGMDEVQLVTVEDDE